MRFILTKTIVSETIIEVDAVDREHALTLAPTGFATEGEAETVEVRYSALKLII